VPSLEFCTSPHGAILFVANAAAGPVRALHADTGQPVEGVRLPPRYEVLSRPAVVPDGRTLLILLESGEVAVWDYRDGR
jgi:hypothetical protein